MSKKKAYRRPAGAPKLQDHKPKQGAPEVLQVEALGRTWVVDMALFDDDELLERLGELREGNPFVAPKIGRTLLGDDYEVARDLLRDPETGRVKASDILEFITTLLQGGAG
ncbi:MAG: hypothetical protein Q4D79_00155 [Propionibacteriaceae bacterium]|nr:hypothetical protein [Propionibacteriaceae bacterium]